MPGSPFAGGQRIEPLQACVYLSGFAAMVRRRAD